MRNDRSGYGPNLLEPAFNKAKKIFSICENYVVRTANMEKVHHFVMGPGRYKYTAVMEDGRRVNFGHRDYEHFRDSVPAALGGGRWSHKDHNDPARRKLYRARHSKVMTKNGTPAYRVKYSPSWFSYHYLW